MRLLFASLVLLLLTLPARAQDAPPAPLTLDSTFITADGRVTLAHPADWYIAENFGQITFLNTQDLSLLTEGAVPLGVAGGSVLIGEGSELPVPDGEASLEAVAALFIADLDAEQGGSGTVVFGDPEPILLGDYPALLVRGTSDSGDQALITLDLGDDFYAVMLGAAGSGELDAMLPTFLAMAASLELAQPQVSVLTLDLDLPVSFTSTSAQGVLSISLPEGWSAEDSAGALTFINSPDPNDATVGIDPEDPEAALDLVYGTVILLPASVALAQGGVTLENVADFFVQSLSADNPDLRFALPERVVVEAVLDDDDQVLILVPGSEPAIDLSLLITALTRDTYGIMIVATTPGLLSDVREVLLNVAAGLRFTAAEP